MTDIGLMSYYLGLEVKQMEEGIFISQASYTKDILKKFNMFDCNPVNTQWKVDQNCQSLTMEKKWIPLC